MSRPRPAQAKRSARIRQRQQRRRKRQRRGRPSRVLPSRRTEPLYRRAVEGIVRRAYGKLLHAKQVLSVFMISLGIVHSDRLGIASVGTAMARRFGKKPKHGIKQVDRCLSNKKLPMSSLFEGLVPLSVGQRLSITVTLDWTEFDKDNHTTACISLVTKGGKRAMPLVWLTVEKSELKNRQRGYERQVMRMLADALPEKVHVLLLADRVFGDVKLYKFIHKELGFDFVIRYRPNIYVSHEGWLWPSRDLVPSNGRIRVLRDTELTAKEVGPYTVVLYKAAGMKDSWCLATSLSDATGREVVDLYAHRFQCEEAYRDLKDRRYGYGLKFTRIGDCTRRDRFLLLFVIAYLVHTLMGNASECLGLDKELRANTVRERTHSLFRQGRALLGKLAGDTYDAVSQHFCEKLRTIFKGGLEDAFA